MKKFNANNKKLKMSKEGNKRDLINGLESSTF